MEHIRAMQNPPHHTPFSWRHGILLLLALVPLVVLSIVHPIAQDPHYHDFADRRAWLGIPNFADVVSNLPFLFVGLAGLYQGWKGRLTGYSTVWACFFAGVTLVSAGSAYYHWNPDNSTLVWDRLPMTIGFMAMFTALLGEFVDARLPRQCLLPALAVGIASVIYWQMFDDLRFYAWVQFTPLLIIPAMLALFSNHYTRQSLLLIALSFYLMAKVLEAGDRLIFQFTGHIIAGHAIKHLLAGGGCFCILEMLRRRKVR